MKDAFSGCKCVFQCAVQGERWGRWGRRRRRGGGLGGSKAPDADPLKKNKEGQAAGKRSESQQKRRKSVKTSRGAARTHRGLLPRTARTRSTFVFFSIRLHPSVHVLERSLHPQNQLRSHSPHGPSPTGGPDRTIRQIIDRFHSAVIDTEHHIHSHEAEGYQSQSSQLCNELHTHLIDPETTSNQSDKSPDDR